MTRFSATLTDRNGRRRDQVFADGRIEAAGILFARNPRARTVRTSIAGFLPDGTETDIGSNIRWVDRRELGDHVPPLDDSEDPSTPIPDARPGRPNSSLAPAPAPPPPAVDLTDVGLQYVIPGCEKDPDRGPAQLSLF